MRAKGIPPNLGRSRRHRRSLIKMDEQELVEELAESFRLAVTRQLKPGENVVLSLRGSLGEALSSHPMLIRRINELRRYAASAQYQRLKALMDQNLA